MRPAWGFFRLVRLFPRNNPLSYSFVENAYLFPFCVKHACINVQNSLGTMLRECQRGQDLSKKMSQRAEAPKTAWSSFLLKLSSYLMCLDEVPNEWQTLWSTRSVLHHSVPPKKEGIYRGHTSVINATIDPVLPEFRHEHEERDDSQIQQTRELKLTASNGFDSM